MLGNTYRLLINLLYACQDYDQYRIVRGWVLEISPKLTRYEHEDIGIRMIVIGNHLRPDEE